MNPKRSHLVPIESAPTAAEQRVVRRLRILEADDLLGAVSVPKHFLDPFLRAGWRIQSTKTLRHSGVDRPDVLLVVLGPLSADQLAALRLRADPCIEPRALVVALCREDDPSIRLSLLESIADLVLSPNIEPRLLEAQVRVIVDRLDPRVMDEPIQSGCLQLDPSIKRLVCQRDGQRLETPLTPTECRILEAMMLRPYRAHARIELVHAVWGVAAEIDVRTIDVHMRRLREGLARIGCQAMLETVRGVGYRLVPD